MQLLGKLDHVHDRGTDALGDPGVPGEGEGEGEGEGDEDEDEGEGGVEPRTASRSVALARREVPSG